jgi:hypothetical protein
VWRTAPVATLVRVMITSGITAPVASVAWPEIDPEACANNRDGPDVMARKVTNPQMIATLHLLSGVKIVIFIHAGPRTFPLAWNLGIRDEATRPTSRTAHTLGISIVITTSTVMQPFRVHFNKPCTPWGRTLCEPYNDQIPKSAYPNCP